MSAPQRNQPGAQEGGRPYIDNAAEGPDGVGPVDRIGTASRILHDCARDHDNVLGGAGQLLDDQVNHLAQAGILVLEELRDAKEERRRFGGREFLARIEEQSDLCEENAASSRLDR